MTRSFFLIVIFLALSCQINEKSEKRYNYLALGDSYTIAESLNLIDSYPHQLKNQLKKIDSVNIIAKTGWTTGELIDTLKSLNIKNGDNVITVSHTATATITAIMRTGAKPNLIDICPDKRLTKEDGIKNGDSFFDSLLFIVKEPS